MESFWTNRGSSSEDADSIISKDALTNALAAFLVLWIVTMTMIGQKQEAKAKQETPPPPGQVGVRLVWSGDIDADLDQWVLPPEGNPIGFTNKVGAAYDLKHDDQGLNLGDNVPAFAKVHEEYTWSNGLIVGETCVNTVLYSPHSAKLPIPFYVEVYVTKAAKEGEDPKGGGTPILVSDAGLEFTKEKQEINIFCFVLDADGNLVPGKEGVYSNQTIKMYTN